MNCGTCGHSKQYHGDYGCDQCEVERKPWANAEHEFTERNKSGNYVV